MIDSLSQLSQWLCPSITITISCIFFVLTYPNIYNYWDI